MIRNGCDQEVEIVPSPPRMSEKQSDMMTLSGHQVIGSLSNYVQSSYHIIMEDNQKRFVCYNCETSCISVKQGKTNILRFIFMVFFLKEEPTPGFRHLASFSLPGASQPQSIKITHSSSVI